MARGSTFVRQRSVLRSGTLGECDADSGAGGRNQADDARLSRGEREHDVPAVHAPPACTPQKAALFNVHELLIHEQSSAARTISMVLLPRTHVTGVRYGLETTHHGHPLSFLFCAIGGVSQRRSICSPPDTFDFDLDMTVSNVDARARVHRFKKKVRGRSMCSVAGGIEAQATSPSDMWRSVSTSLSGVDNGVNKAACPAALSNPGRESVPTRTASVRSGGREERWPVDKRVRRGWSDRPEDQSPLG